MTSSTSHGMDVWSSPAWRQLAISWMDKQLAAAGSPRTSEVEQPHLRPWATVLKAQTTSGTVWFKACGPATAFEAGLYRLVGHVAPEHVLSPIATDRTRGSGTSFESQAQQGAGRRFKSQHTGTSQRYNPGSLPARPGRSIYPKSQSGGSRMALAHAG